MHVYWYNFSLYFILLTSFYAASCSAITAKAADLGMGEGSSRSLGAVDNFEAEIGKGVTCTVDGVLIQNCQDSTSHSVVRIGKLHIDLLL